MLIRSHPWTYCCSAKHSFTIMSVSVLLILLVAGLAQIELGLATAGPSQCIVKFKGEILKFRSCKADLADGVSVYWSIKKRNGAINTLFVAKPTAGGYIGWRWGQGPSLGSSMAVAFIDDKTGKAKLENRYVHATRSESKLSLSNETFLAQDADITSDGMLMGFFIQRLEGLKSSEMDAFWLLGTNWQWSSVHLAGAKKFRIASARFNMSEAAMLSDTDWQGHIIDRLLGSWNTHRMIVAAALLLLAPAGVLLTRKRSKSRGGNPGQMR